MNDNFIYKNIKIYQVGSTGLVQQRIRRYNDDKSVSRSILIFIKDACKNQFNFDIIAINSGAYYKFVE
jgi:hypothetical protein